MTDETLKRNREESDGEDVGVELPPEVALQEGEEDGDVVGPELPPQQKKRKVWLRVQDRPWL